MAGGVLINGASDGDLSGRDVANAAGAGIGATAGTYAGTAIGSIGGPAGSAIGGYVGGFLGAYAGQFATQTLFPNRNGPAEDYSALQAAPFTGGQGNGVQYRIESQGRTSVNGVVRIAPPTPNVTTGIGPIGYYYPDTTENTEGITLVDRSGRIVANVRVSSGNPETKLTAEFVVMEVDRVDGLPDTDGNADGAPRPAPRGTRQAQQNQSGVDTQPQGPQISPLAFAPALIPALAPTPQTPQGGPGPATPTRGATNPNATRNRATRPRTANPINPAGNGNRNSPPPPTRTRTRGNCGCNKGILDGVKNMFTANAADGAQLGLLAKIDRTTVANNAGIVNTINIVSNIQKFSRKTWDFLQVDRFLAVANFTFNLHNAYFLSRSIGDTMGWAVDSVLRLFNLGLTDADDNPIGVNDLISEWIDSAVDRVVPDETQQEISGILEKANRIYQAATNLYYSMWSLFDITQSLTEITGQYVARIGNALRKSGTVLENSFGWMSERMDRVYTSNAHWQRLNDILDGTEQGVSSVGMIADEVLEFQDIANELGNQKTALYEAVRTESRVDSSSEVVSQVVTQEELENKLDSEAPVNMADAEFDVEVAGAPDDDN